MSFRVLSYSYKGGTGRTTSTANIAAALAQNHSVLCIDLDVDAPGLGILFGFYDNLRGIKDYNLYLQDYLTCEDPASFDIEKALIDVSKESGTGLKFNKTLKVFPSKIKYPKSISFTGNTTAQRLESLLKKIEETGEFEYIILDSPSGFGEMAAISMYVSEYILLFFRYCLQHVEGTIQISHFINKLALDYLPVATSVPRDNPGFTEPMKVEILKKLTGRDIFEIPENNSLKWNERIVLFDSEDKFPGIKKMQACYSNLANKLVKERR
ncbi:MAG: ParA family protein [Nanoarchaeota archaeon]|nr:ParA family protein [Nanoarchaeota archaeon]